MKRVLPYLFFNLILFSGLSSYAQVVTSQIKAGFGIEGDLRRNFFSGVILDGNDDWYSNLSGTGISVIDTTGAAQIVSNYIANSNSRLTPLFRSMAYPQYASVNNRVLIDAVL